MEISEMAREGNVIAVKIGSTKCLNMFVCMPC